MKLKMSDQTENKDLTNTKSSEVSSNEDIANFLKKVSQTSGTIGRHGRLMFAMDATFSRQPAWDYACKIQSEMFAKAAEVGQLDIQLAFFRGFDEFKCSKWLSDSATLGKLMSRIECRGGITQIRKVIDHAVRETSKKKVQALVYVGDMVEESADEICGRAGQLGLLGVPAFLFQEGGDHSAEAVFREVARLTKGAYFRFDESSAETLGELLRAVAIYATGGFKVLQQMDRSGDRSARKLLTQLT